MLTNRVLLASMCGAALCVRTVAQDCNGNGIPDAIDIHEGATRFYSFDHTSDPSYEGYYTFDANPQNPISPLIAEVDFGGNPSVLKCDIGPDGRLFGTDGDTVFALDSVTGFVLGSYTAVESGIEGLAVGPTGVIYLSRETASGGEIWAVDFDTQQQHVVVSGAFEIDDIDFDGDGNLIGTDFNQSGQLWRIPVDGTQPSVITTLPAFNVGEISFSARDAAFWLITDDGIPGGRYLWRLTWSGGQPQGGLEYVKEIAPPGYGLVGLAARGSSNDCNDNDIPDECDMADGSSTDWNQNNVPDECDCLGDISGNGDGAIGLDDLAEMLSQFGTTCPPAQPCDADLNRDGVVDLMDLAIMLSIYGRDCV